VPRSGSESPTCSTSLSGASLCWGDLPRATTGRNGSTGSLGAATRGSALAWRAARALRWCAALARRDSRLEQLAHQRDRQRVGRIEVQRGLGLVVRLHVSSRGRERRPAEREIRAPFARREEPGYDVTRVSKRGYRATDALLDVRQDREDRLPKPLQRGSPVRAPRDLNLRQGEQFSTWPLTPVATRSPRRIRLRRFGDRHSLRGIRARCRCCRHRCRSGLPVTCRSRNSRR
jgi:hypothetical protein